MNLNQDSSSPIKFTPGKDSSDSKSSSDVRNRPVGGIKGGKDFQKVLDSNSSSGDGEDNESGETGDMTKSKGIKDQGDDFIILDDPDAKKKAPPSLFDLSASKPVKAKGTNIDSPSDLYAKLSSAKKPDMVDDTKFTTRFATEQADLSYVNPLAAVSAMPIQSPTIGKSEPVVPEINLQAIIDQLVDKVVELKTNDRTETTITLKQPPMFQGANIVLTSFDSAKGEFNISFENLSQQAKNILDQQVNRQSLMSNLEQKGYTVHIVNTTTLIEHPIIASAQPEREPDRERREPDQRQRRRQQGEEEA